MPLDATRETEVLLAVRAFNLFIILFRFHYL